MTPHNTILYYHSVGDIPLSVPSDAFRRQVRWLAEKGYAGNTVSCCAEERANGDSGQGVAITFDDCFESVYENALPILKLHNFKATFFATVDYAGKTRWGSEKHQRWSDEKSGEFNIPFRHMTWDQLKSLVDSGMEIGAHTITHRNLTELSSREQEEEIAGSKDILEKRLGVTVETFCYPRGKYDEQIIDIVKKAGFKTACTTNPGHVVNGCRPYELGRFPVGNSNLEFRSLFVRQYKLLCGLKKSARLAIKRVLK
jgi:peptidoglycan/xylan/chitin deacetylase (PgdA/CDA1 family)